jgi:hypothetical protein
MTIPDPEPVDQVHFGSALYDPGVSDDPEAAAEGEAEWADEWNPAVGHAYVGGIKSDPDLALDDEDWWAAMAEAYTHGRFEPSPGSREAEAFARFNACARADAEWLAAFVRAQQEAYAEPEAGL